MATSDSEINNILRSNKSHGWIRHLDKNAEIFKAFTNHDKGFLFPFTGYNLRLTEPQAAIGIEQIKKLNMFVTNRRIYAEKLIALLSSGEISGYISLQAVEDKGTSSYFGIPIVLKEELKMFKEEIMSKLKDDNIECRPFLCGNFTRQPVMRKIKHEIWNKLTVSEMLHKSAFAIPCHQDLSSKDAEIIYSKICKVIMEIKQK